MKSLTLRSPAKLNLYLKVLHKRPDGYHNLKTLFERIDLFDEIRLVSNSSGRIRVFCDHPQVPCGPKNLVFRVAAQLKEKYAIPQGVDIHIRKRIPVAAGLAGGSSNAATTLLGLNRIWGLDLSQQDLWQFGRTIGSDVPFFLSGATWALGLERGDVLRPQNIPVRLWHVLVVPKMKMYTREVYERLNLQLTRKDDNVNILLRSFKRNNIKRAKQLFSNDLETSIVRICPRLLDIKQKIERVAGPGACFSGSGPSIFRVMDSRQDAEAAARVLAKRYRQVFVVGTLA